MNKTAVMTNTIAAAVLLITLLTGVTHSVAQTAVAASGSGFPDLTGQYKVGRTAYEWVDQSRDEKFASIAGLKRDLMVNIWFPAEPAKYAKIAPYMGDSVSWTIVTNHPELESQVKARAYMTNAVASGQPSYPVIIFDPDNTIPIFAYSSIIEELASHGYIVVGMSHPYDTVVIRYPDGRIVLEGSNGQGVPSSMDDSYVRTTLIQDVHFVLTQLQNLNEKDPDFKGRLDLTKIAVMGHSYGGLIAQLSATAESKIVAGVSLENDPVTTSVQPTTKPFLYMGLGAAPKPEQQTKDSYWVYSNQLQPGNFGDFAWLQFHGSLPNNDGVLGNIDPASAIEITNNYLLAFFNHYLAGSDLTWPTNADVKVIAFPTTS